MEALGSPSISRAPMGGGHAFRIPKTSVCLWQVQQQYTIVRLPEIHFTASGFFLKIFDRLCACIFVSFWSCFFAKLKQKKHEKQKKQQHKNNNNSLTGRTNTLFCRFVFRLSREKSVKSMCYLKIYIKVYLMHKVNHVKLKNRRRMDRNKTRSGDKIQNGRDHKFCRLTSKVSWLNLLQLEYLALLDILLLSARPLYQ